MTTRTARGEPGASSLARLPVTGTHRHMLLPRIVAGVPLLLFGLAHVFVPDASMRLLVEAAGIPLAALVSPIAVAAEIVAGLSLLLGFWARIGGALGVVTMAAATYSHVVIDVWPNGEENEPPLVLPIVLLLCSAYVAWRGAGRWSLDRRRISSPKVLPD